MEYLEPKEFQNSMIKKTKESYNPLLNKTLTEINNDIQYQNALNTKAKLAVPCMLENFKDSKSDTLPDLEKTCETKEYLDSMIVNADLNDLLKLRDLTTFTNTDLSDSERV